MEKEKSSKNAKIEGKEIGKTGSTEEKNTTEPFPMLEIMQRLPEVFENKVLSKLNETDLKFFSWTRKTCRDALKRMKIDDALKEMKIHVYELSSTSMLKWAWDNYPFEANNSKTFTVEYFKKLY